MSEDFNWKKEKVAEDEISIAWKKSATIENDAQMERAAELSQMYDFWSQIEKYAEECEEILDSHVLPRPMKMVRHDGGRNWWLHLVSEGTRPPVGETWRFEIGRDFVLRNYPDLSDPWYAAKIGFRCREALMHHEMSNLTNSLFAMIFEIATLRKDWMWRRKYKSHIIRGKKTQAAASTGGEMRAANSREKRSSILDEMGRLIKNGRNISQSAELAAKAGFGTSQGANRKLWDRHKK